MVKYVKYSKEYYSPVEKKLIFTILHLPEMIDCKNLIIKVDHHIGIFRIHNDLYGITYEISFENDGVEVGIYKPGPKSLINKISYEFSDPGFPYNMIGRVKSGLTS